MKNDPKGIALALTATMASALILGLISVWLNIERVDKAYNLRRMEKILNEQEALEGKLEVENNNLLSPIRLRKLAKKYGFGPASQGQIRRPRENRKQ
ncbi:hypothetical protein [Maridesulfovibrio ferrireducens]|uniref:Cell division protein FtsL n=1 Tax=Maridesulfovibrio ferrireducens TaxID=246191 RepID=A0A1G9AVL5_9BACT|nr:hypothetical protein [Maridesulfovibrio ferrireducens]MBI9109737.1 hypothetical protein [Maridesulfovibrio ferrireducens]SDK31449.1 hypothetical protein SAMN05660337_0049 [Maridesulfovibrio ferrireducens]